MAIIHYQKLNTYHSAEACDVDPSLQCANLAISFHENEEPNFIKDNCGGKLNKACQDMIKTAVKARLQLRYKKADMETFNLHCTADPAKCENLEWAESVMADLHNDEINRIAGEQSVRLKAAIRRARNQDDERRMQSLANGLKSFGDSMQRSSASQATCRSRPDGFGGMNTTCY